MCPTWCIAHNPALYCSVPEYTECEMNVHFFVVSLILVCLNTGLGQGSSLINNKTECLQSVDDKWYHHRGFSYGLMLSQFCKSSYSRQPSCNWNWNQYWKCNKLFCYIFFCSYFNSKLNYWVTRTSVFTHFKSFHEVNCKFNHFFSHYTMLCKKETKKCGKSCVYRFILHCTNSLLPRAYFTLL